MFNFLKKSSNKSNSKSVWDKDYVNHYNNLYKQSEQYKRENNYEAQIDLLFQVFYFNLAGFTNYKDLQIMLDEQNSVKPLQPLVPPRIFKNIRIAANKLNLAPNQIIDRYLQIIKSDSLPVHLFTVQETAQVLSNCFSCGVDEANKLIANRTKFKVINIKCTSL